MFLRKFIILNSQGSKDAKGHAKLEVRASKAKLSLSIEGAEQSKNTVYKLYIVSNEKNNFKEIELGAVDVDKRARGKLDLGFNANAVVQTNLSIDNFNILILKREDHITKQSEIILGGYIHKDDDSLSKVKIKHKNNVGKIKNIENITIEQEQEEVKEKEKEEKQQIIEEQEASKTVEASKVSEIPQTKIASDYESHIEHYQNHEKSCEQIAEQKESSDKHYNDQIASYTEDILKIFKQVNPFKIEFEDYRWWQIDCEEMNSHRGFLPYYSYILNSDNQNKQDKSNHYLFGMIEKEDEITHYIYAIPGKYERKDHPHGGKTGFVTWLEDKTGSGYWLSYIDARTGNVVRPS